MPDMINSPPHYMTKLKDGTPLECIDVIEALHLPFKLANVIKYLWRAGGKGTSIEDLKKAQWYLNRHIEQMSIDNEF